jgi:ABC-type spermidine/putrescine transport system permease subunit II
VAGLPTRLLAALFALAVFSYLLLPTLLVVTMSLGRDDVIRFPPQLLSFRWYAEGLTDSAWTTPAIRSLLVAATTAIMATTIGTGAAVAVVRGTLPFRRAFELLAISPMMVPPIILAVGGYGLYVKLKLVGSLAGLAVVHTVLAVPFVFLLISAALYRLDPRLELASQSLGAGHWATLRHVTLPLVAPAMMMGALFAALTSFDEVVLALFLVGTTAPTLPIKIFSGITFGVSPVVAAISSLLVAASIASLAAVALLRRWQTNRST